MKSTAKKLAVCAAAFCLLACGTAVSAAAASPVSGLALSGITMPWDQNVPAESIEAGSYTANMLLGSSQQLSPVVRPRNSTDSVVYISDDTSILTVSNTGVVQAVGVGTTRITAAAGNQICAYTIVVSMDSSMIVTEMDLSLSSNTIYVGNSVSAQLQVRPTSASNYATVTLTSSNEKVATVNNFGRVTGVAPGTATITATCGSVTATTNVTVMSIPNSGTGTGTGTRKYHIRFNGIFGSCICNSGTCCRGISAGSIRFRCGWHLINNFQSFFVIGTYFLSFVGFYCVVVCSSTLHFFICVRCFGTAFHSFDFFPGTVFCLTHNIVAGSAFTLFPGNFNTFVYTYHLGKLRCF